MKPPIKATEVPPRSTPSAYPPPFAARMEGRQKRQLGDQFGLHNFGVNLTTLEPGAVSALQHRPNRQDELLYVLYGEVPLVSGTEIGRASCRERVCQYVSKWVGCTY